MSIQFSIKYGTTVKIGTSATIRCSGKKLAEDIVIMCEEVSSMTKEPNEFGTTVIIGTYTELF